MRVASTPIARERRSTIGNYSQATQLVGAVAEEQPDAAVPELKFSDGSRRVPVLRGKDRDLEDLAKLHRRLVDALAGERLNGSGGQLPLHDLALDLLVRDLELDACVRVREVQLLEPALQDDLFIQVVDARHGMVGADRDAGSQEGAQDDQSSESSAH